MYELGSGVRWCIWGRCGEDGVAVCEGWVVGGWQVEGELRWSGGHVNRVSIMSCTTCGVDMGQMRQKWWGGSGWCSKIVVVLCRYCVAGEMKIGVWRGVEWVWRSERSVWCKRMGDSALLGLGSSECCARVCGGGM